MSNSNEKDDRIAFNIVLTIIGIFAFWYFQEPSFNKKTQWTSFLAATHMCNLTGKSRGMALKLKITDQQKHSYLLIDKPSIFNNIIHRDTNYQISSSDENIHANITFELLDSGASDKYSYYNVPMFLVRDGLQDRNKSDYPMPSLINNILRSEIITIRKKTKTSASISDDKIGILEITSKEHKKIIADFTECLNSMGWV
jgi:hypothetical protein